MIFERIARLLGVRYFKKYWPVEGSYWRTNHIKKDDRNQLRFVINRANEFTAIHREQFANQIVLFALCFIFDTTRRREYGVLLCALVIYHGYAFMVHEYNRRLARRAISALPEEKSDKKTEDSNAEISVQKMLSGADAWYVRDNRTYNIYGPYFHTIGEAEAWLKYIMTNVPKNKIFETYYMDKFKSLFTSHLSRRLS